MSVHESGNDGRLLAYKVTKACEQVLELEETRLALLDYIESRMNILAPNLTVVVGSKVAAQMMAMAGGLQVRDGCWVRSTRWGPGGGRRRRGGG